MAVAIARRLRDGETIAVGSVSPIPASACLLAKRSHAPSARLILLGSRAHFPFNGGVQEFYNFAVRGRLDVFFASGAQIDQHGNFNLSVIGEYEHPKVRLPGGRANGILAFVAKRLILFRTEHSRRVFVPRVDFVTAPGVPPEGAYRLGGLHAVVTDLCVFEFPPERGRLELASVHPGVTLAGRRGEDRLPAPRAVARARDRGAHRGGARPSAGPGARRARGVLSGVRQAAVLTRGAEIGISIGLPESPTL
jgi:glutaconate CoA-transferase subunit B